MPADHHRDRLLDAANSLGINVDADQSPHARTEIAAAVLGTVEALTVAEATRSANQWPTGEPDDPMPLIEHRAFEAAGLLRQGYYPVWLVRRLAPHLRTLAPHSNQTEPTRELVDAVYALLSATV